MSKQNFEGMRPQKLGTFRLEERWETTYNTARWPRHPTENPCTHLTGAKVRNRQKERKPQRQTLPTRASARADLEITMKRPCSAK